MTTKLRIKPRESLISNREREFILLAARGFSNKEIAATMYVSERTVKTTMHRAYVKLRAHSRYQAIVEALKLRLFSIEEILTEDELVELLATAKPETINRVTRKALSRAPDFNYPE
jgi:DNA-binding CsgD family transcriptional regulator